ncbi:MAG TPA: type II secretion system F family protein [Gemmataceae bacterium]|nr:type II secretion system F family protein [Gemmataceae bacterium]
MAIFFIVFLTVTLGLVGSVHAASRYFQRDAQRARRRIAENFGKDQPRNSSAQLYQHMDLAASYGHGSATGNPVLPSGFQHKLISLMEQARLHFSKKHLLLLAVIVAIALGLGYSGMWIGGLWFGLGAAAVGAALPIVLADQRRKARREKYLKQIPNAFDLMARVIRAGQSVPQSLMAVADTFEDPIAHEFGSCQQQQNLGLSPEVTFQQLSQRSGIVELRIFAMAMMIQRQTGGNLSEVLERLANLIRTRLQLRKQVRAWTAEGRLQGWTLVSLPFLMFGVLMVINRSYVSVLFDHTSLLVATVALMGLGVFWIQRIVNFDY